MATIGSLPALCGGFAKTAASRAPRVEKSPDCSEPHGESRQPHMPRDRRNLQTDRRAVSRAGTSGPAPLWYGPRLRTPFVAQVIGQVLEHGRPAAKPAYGETNAPMALMVDENA